MSAVPRTPDGQAAQAVPKNRQTTEFIYFTPLPREPRGFGRIANGKGERGEGSAGLPFHCRIRRSVDTRGHRIQD